MPCSEEIAGRSSTIVARTMVRSSGTNRSSQANPSLPVPRSPTASQPSESATVPAGTRTVRFSGSPLESSLGAPSRPNAVQWAASQVAWWLPLAKFVRAVTA